MKVKYALTAIVVGLASSGAFSNEIDSALRQNTSGTARFTSGFIFSLGYNKSDNLILPSGNQIKTSGPELTIGYSIGFTPIRDFAELEIGLGYKLSYGKYGSESSNYKSYDSLIKSPFLLGALAFPLANGGSYSAGIQLYLPGNISVKNESGMEVIVPGLEAKGRKILYIERQFGKTMGSEKLGFVQIGFGDSTYSANNMSDQKIKVISLSGGLKF